MRLRWTARGKADILKRIDDGTLTDKSVWNLFEISTEELAEWRRNFAARGIAGLRVTKRQPSRRMT